MICQKRIKQCIIVLLTKLLRTIKEMWKKYEGEPLSRGKVIRAGIYSRRLLEVEITAPDKAGKWWAWDDINRMEVLVDESIIEYIFTGTECEYEDERLTILENRAKRHNISSKEYHRTRSESRKAMKLAKNKENLINIPLYRNPLKIV